MLSFYNTLSGRMEEFVPLQKGQVRLYTCGPTVYDYAHIGNYRSFLFGDILRRHLRGSGFELLHVMNITDVDDKTIRNAAAAGLSLSEYTDRFIQAFFEDSANLSLQRPELVPRATEHIPDMVRTIRQLGDKGFTYSREGSVYFRIANFPQYGKLSKIDLSGMQPGARIDQDEYEKADIRDFVLWKAPKPGEPFWETELGPGRPGWHIECSVMANKYLGESFDIHAGGTDLIFPHHENEIAQSESLSGKMFARYWLHCAHLLVDGQKMSKSTGNYLTLRDLLQQEHTAASIRYLLSSVPYRRQLNFTTDGLRQAAHSIERLKNFRFRLSHTSFPEGTNTVIEAKTAAFPGLFRKAMDDDLNTAQALGVLFELVRAVNSVIDRGEFRSKNTGPVLGCLAQWNKIFEVLPNEAEGRSAQGFLAAGQDAAPASAGNHGMGSAEIKAKMQERAMARWQRNFALADRIRDELSAAGILIEDTKEGVRWKRK